MKLPNMEIQVALRREKESDLSSPKHKKDCALVAETRRQMEANFERAKRLKRYREPAFGEATDELFAIARKLPLSERSEWVMRIVGEFG